MFYKELIIHRHRIIFSESTSHSQMLKRFQRWVEKWGVAVGFIILQGKEVVWEEIIGKEKGKEVKEKRKIKGEGGVKC